MYISEKSKFSETKICLNDSIISGNILSMVSMSLDTLFNIRPIGVISNRLRGFLKMRALTNLYNFSEASIVPNKKVIDDNTIEKTKKKNINKNKYKNLKKKIPLVWIIMLMSNNKYKINKLQFHNKYILLQIENI